MSRDPTADEVARAHASRAAELIDDDLTGFTDHLTKWVDRTLALDTLTDGERKDLAWHRYELNTGVNWIRNFRGDDERLKRIVTFALGAAFHIGEYALRSPIEYRIGREKTNASTAHARKPRKVKSEAIQATIVELAEAVWKKKPATRESAGKTADEIFPEVKRRLGGEDAPLKTANAVERRVRELMKLRTAGQSSD
jgi:hypothetical protein